LTQALDLLSDGGSLNIEMTQGPPIDILTPCNGRENGIIAPLGLILERGNRDIDNRKHEVVSTKGCFTSEKSVEFEFAMLTVERPWRDDGNEKDRLIDRLLDFQFPQLAWSNRCLILPQSEVPIGASELSAQLALNAIS
jgi:hypothetical protein